VRILQLITVASVTAGLGSSGFVAAQDPPPVPIAQEPRHHVVFESPTMRIHDIQVPPGDTTLFHTHDTAILYVPIFRSTTRSQVLGGEWSGGAAASTAATPPPTPAEAARPRPAYSVTTYVEKLYTHRLNNFGPTLFRLVGIANRSKGANGAADDVSGLSAKPEVENNWYRAHRVMLAPGESTPTHRHATPVVVVMQTVGAAASDSEVWLPLNGPGDIARHSGAAPHTLRNAGPTAVELVEVEVRGAGQ
jgi:hypothetical protein